MSRRLDIRLFAVFAFTLGVLGACGDPNEQQPRPGTGGTGGIVVIPPGTGGSGGGEGGAGGIGGGGGGEARAFQIDTVQPPRGPVHGGTRVILTGSGFVHSIPDEERTRESTVVLFDGNPALDTRVIDDRTIFTTAPTGLEGLADVTVQNPSGEETCAGCFRFMGPVSLSAVEPSTGPIEGGTEITLHGEGLHTDMVILFGESAALLPEEQADGSLSVILPGGSREGLVDVRAFGENGQALLRRAFSYTEGLSITSIDPPGSPLAGGNAATVEGTGFTVDSVVAIDGVELPTSFVDGALGIVVPPGAAVGPALLEVRDPAGTATLPFAYYDPADTSVALHSVAPPFGPAAGGAQVGLVGSGFDPATMAVYFGGVASPSVTVESPHLAWASTPPGAAGVQDVRIRTAGDEATLPGAYRFLPDMAITSVAPEMGPTAGGTPITLEGRDFPAEARVFVGALEATGVNVVSDSQIEAVTPQGADGSVGITVLDAADPLNRAFLPNAFFYEGPLSVSLVEPSNGARAGGSMVVLRGKGFHGAMEVRFGDNPSPDVQVIDAFTLEAIAPPGDSGYVDLEILREDGERAVLDAAFSYYNPASAGGGSSGGPLGGVLNVTALVGRGERQGSPIEGCDIYVGADELSRLHKTTDARGQATFAAPSLIKATSVTVLCQGYEAATVANQSSENLTVLLATYAPPEEEEEEEDEGEPPEPIIGTAGGKVFGFKLPPNRTLGPEEEEVALVQLAQPHIYSSRPFGNFGSPVMEVPNDGGIFAIQFEGPFHYTFYATYGIRHTGTGAFEPLLFGYSRGVALPPGGVNYDVNIILDTRLDVEVPVTIQNPPGNTTNSVEVTAFLDLGGDGLIPLSRAMNDTSPNQALLKGMPNISGESLLFQGFGMVNGGVPYVNSYRRQGGSIANGITIGPMLGAHSIVQPPVLVANIHSFNGTFEWELDPSPLAPDLVYISVIEQRDDPEPDVSVWHAVVPGNERRVSIPDAVLADLRARYPFPSVLAVTFMTGSQARFDFDQWSYQNTSPANFTSFTYEFFGIVIE